MYRNQEAKHYNNKISGTCHKTLYHIFSNIQKHKKHCDCENKCKYILNVKMIQLDEASMLDTFVFYDLLKYCKYFNSRLILLGDVEQLPSIGPGKILKHLIDSEIFTVTKLSKIKRQNSGSLVNNILKMSTNTVQVADCSIDETMTLYNIENYIINNKEINNQELELLIDKCNFNQENVKFITGFATEKKIFNTNNLNNLLQNKFNFKNVIIPSNHKYEDSFVFKVKDKIIRIENDYSSKKMRANGEEASILDFDGTKVIIQYSGAEDKPEKIGIDELYENFRLNYCITVHKSQGSQYQNVIFIIEPNQTFTDKKSIYTAISRAKSRCIIISKPCDFINLQKDLKKIDFKVSLLLKESDNYTFPN
jgi:exodeoxyribonuclease V alpha subunit